VAWIWIWIWRKVIRTGLRLVLCLQILKASFKVASFDSFGEKRGGKERGSFLLF
jgi:hypothetical protein